MKNFIDNSFLLESETQKHLYFDYAATQPIFDWHCHLTAEDIYKNEQPKNLSQLWLGGDHYKWRMMRSAGVEERSITGEASDFEKFKAFCSSLPFAIGNPLVHWSHLELKRYFGIDSIINSKNAEDIWELSQKKLQNEDYTPQSIIKKSNVYALCTTDDPTDDLLYHQKLKESFCVPVLPAFRPDRALNITADDFPSWCKKLENVSNIEINSFEALVCGLERRVGYFKQNGCVASDQSLGEITYAPADAVTLDKIFKKRMGDEIISAYEIKQFQFNLMCALGKIYAENDLAMELHLGAMRNNNTFMFKSIGADCGFDSIGDGNNAFGLSRLLDKLNNENKLPKTILFCLNPNDNYVIGTMLGNFQSSSAFGKIQFGSGWWFNDNIDGMKAQLKALSNLGVLGTFVGMVTDSRSFLSYPRHEYFRRILCSIVGQFVDGGLYPKDEDALEQIIEGISFKNAKNYFGI